MTKRRLRSQDWFDNPDHIAALAQSIRDGVAKLDFVPDLILTSFHGMPLRTLELVARDKACEHPDKACHGDSCPLAQGFYDRLPAARAAAVQAARMDRAQVRDIALTHRICPYYLTQALVRWSDVVVGDYNHFFDPYAMLHALVASEERSAALLVDEAHNLVERARGMYSAELDQRVFAGLGGKAPAPLKRPLGRVQRYWNDLHREQLANYQVQPELPLKLLGALQQISQMQARALLHRGAPHPSQQLLSCCC